MTDTELTLGPLPTKRDDPFDPPTELRGRPPVSPLLFAGGAVGWLVTSYAEARAVLTDPRFSADRSLAESPLRPVPTRFRQRGTPPGMFNSMDPPLHTRYRKMLTGQFTVRRMKELEPRIECIVSDTLQSMYDAHPPVDLVSSFALPVPMMVICELLGVPYEHRPEFQRIAAVLLNVESSVGQLMATVDELREYMLRVVKMKRRTPDKALISGLLSATDLSDEELINISQVLLLAGHETSANMLGLGTFALLQHPDEWNKLRAEPSLLPSAVEELLRYLTIAHMGPVRAALEEIELAGITVRKGQTILVSLPLANRDTDLLEDGDTMDVARTRTHHLAFGYGVHQCIGQQLARVEMLIGFRQLLERFSDLRLAVDPSEVAMRSDMLVYGVHRLPVTW